MSAAASGAAPAPNPPYQRSAPVLSFTAHGVPKPQGSKNAFQNPKTGRIVVTESSKHLRPWRTQVTNAIRDAIARTDPPAMGWPLLGPLALDLLFTMPKPVSAPKTRRTWPITYPDLDKLARAIFDAGSPSPKLKFDGAWADDSQIISLHADEVYPLETPGALTYPGVTATVYLLDADRPAVEMDALFDVGGAP